MKTSLHLPPPVTNKKFRSNYYLENLKSLNNAIMSFVPEVMNILYKSVYMKYLSEDIFNEYFEKK